MILQNETWYEWNLFHTIFLIIGLIFISILIIIVLWIVIKDKIHNSYHKGYRHANKEGIRYYETLETLIKRFDNILNEMDISDTNLSLELSKLLFNFKSQLKSFQEV